MHTKNEINHNTDNSNCCDNNPSDLSLIAAQQLILENITTYVETEVVPIRNAIGRILREDIVSQIDIPPNDNSAMDGYAINYQDSENATTTEIELKIVGKAFAGAPFLGELAKGQAVRIMTGAKVPSSATAIIMQEKTITNSDNQSVKLLAQVKKGENIRQKGEDINIGKTVILSGKLLTPACIGVLASLGITEVMVSRKINVVIFSTGDELQNVGSNLADGNIYDSNRYSLLGLLNKPYINVIEKGLLADNQTNMQQAITQMSNYADIIITSGGVSVGEADWVKPCINNIGKLIFWRAKIKPGRPILFAKINATLFFGLPGNPVSAMVTFMKFTQLAIDKLSGQQQVKQLTVKAKSLSEFKKKAGRIEFARGILQYNTTGELCVSTCEQGSGILSSMTVANCLIKLDENCTQVNINELVNVEPFSTII